MTGKKQLLTVTIAFEVGTPNEVEIIAWLSKNLQPAEWTRVLQDVGERGVLEWPVAVLRLAPSARMTVMETFGVRRLGDLTKLSENTLRETMQVVAFEGLMRRVKLFGLDLRA